MSVVPTRKQHAAVAVPRSEDTRQRLINAALSVFGAYGFEGASTRMIADQAGTNLAAIPYYFRGKEGLYRAAAESIVEACRREMSPVIQRAHSLRAQRNSSRRAALRVLHELLDRFSGLVIRSSDVDNWSSFVMREQLQPGAAFEILYEGIMREVSQACMTLLALALKRRVDDPEIAVRAHAILGQITVFQTGRATVCRLLGWSDFAPRHLKLIQKIVRENINQITSLNVRGS
jgi:AcrR family transcriptional regulator